MKIPSFSETIGRHIDQDWSMEDDPMEYKSSTKWQKNLKIFKVVWLYEAGSYTS